MNLHLDTNFFLLSAFSKIFEKVNSSINLNNTLGNEQSEYRKKKSHKIVLHSILQLKFYVFVVMNCMLVDTLYDIDKVFDYIKYEILLLELICCGIRIQLDSGLNHTFIWVETKLWDWGCRAYSCRDIVKYGVSWDSILSPLLFFLMYVNKLIATIDSSIIISHAEFL
jgi:hypothetical protein